MAAGYRLDRFEGLNNEPDMEAPYAYHWAGRPDRTAQVVHDVVTNQFGTGRGGLPGNDDSGGLSSWYVWASLGLFPVAGQNRFLVNAPSWRHAELEVGGHTLGIQTEGFREPEPGAPAQYVQGITFNGRPLDRSWLSGHELHRGGHLVVRLGAQPNGWGTDEVSRPPSSRSPVPLTTSSGPAPLSTPVVRP